MNNIVAMQKELLNCIPRNTEIHNNPTNIYVEIGVDDVQDLFVISEVTDKVIAFTPNEFLKNDITNLKNPKIEVMDTIHAVDCLMLKIDAHMNNEQSNSEFVILHAFRDNIVKCNPVILIRAEDPYESGLVCKLLHRMNYQSYFFIQSKDDQIMDKVWLVGISNLLELGDSIGQNTSITGHPKQPAGVSDVTYEFILPKDEHIN